jgi:2-dehydro-3-deoxygluconokinase
MKIIFFGECMIEYRANSINVPSDELNFGGDSLNSALYLARLLTQSHHQVSYATGIGHDDDSNKLLCYWQGEGINTEFVKKINSKNLGRYYIETNDQGERNFSYDRDDSAAKYYFKKDKLKTLTQSLTGLEQILSTGKADYFYFSGISLAILAPEDCNYLFELLTLFKRCGGKIIFDNNYRPILWQHSDPLPCYQQAMTLVDIGFLTDEDEYALYGGDSVDSIIERYQTYEFFKEKELIIKQGEQACVIKPSVNKSYRYSKEDELIYVDCPAVSKDNIIDTCAAGDSFAAAYLAKRLTGKSIETSAAFAHLLAGRVIQYSGAIIEKSQMKDLIL